MKNKVLVMVLALVMVFSFSAAAFADSGNGGIMPYETGHVTFLIERTSGTTADVDVIVSFTRTVDEYSVVVFLQKNVNGTWENDTTNPDYDFYNNGFHSSTCAFSNIYDSLSYGTAYRLMVVSRDKIGDSEYRTTTYSNPF